VTGERVLAIGLDGFEISYADELMNAGKMPVLEGRRRHGAHILLDHGAAQRTGLGWEEFWSGLSDEAADRHAAIEFDPADYSVWQEGARFAPFTSPLDVRTVVFDVPYVDLARAPSVEGVAAWGAHDPGVSGAASNPRELLGELLSEVGPYPSSRWTYGVPWPSAAATRKMGDGLVEGIAARSEAARWLLADRLADWDLAIVVVAEPHPAAEAFWHGVDPTHPLHDHPSAQPAADGLSAVYQACDRFVGDLVDATDASTVVVFSMGGLGPNRSDVQSMVLLPELVFRWALGERLLEGRPEWTATPAQVPVVDDENSAWQRDWYPTLTDDRSGTQARRLSDHLPGPVRRRVRAARSARRARSRPTGYQNVTWQPAAWYQPRWPEMRAFALPSFYDGRVRVNLRGREARGIVDVCDYERVCDEVEALVRGCVDPRTGRPVADDFERRPAGEDPLTLGSAAADLVVVWNSSVNAFEHPEHGLVGPVPFRRTGGHTGVHGFASITGEGIEPGDHGVASSFDIAPTIVDLLGAAPIDGISGTSLLTSLRAPVPSTSGA
jgi:predicted AlkP superfamily phosphohydrolase/phosphomutase